MTPERKKWWDSLPQGERELREAIKECRYISKNIRSRLDAIYDIDVNSVEVALDCEKMLRRQKLITKALKHELERGGSATMQMFADRKLPMPPVTLYCSACRSMVAISAIELKFCPNCGKKIKEIVKE